MTTPAPAAPPQPLTPRQLAVLDAIRSSRARRGVHPTPAELAVVTGIPAGDVQDTVDGLTARGWLRPTTPAPAPTTPPQATEGPQEPSAAPARPSLTPRQREALQHAADGLTRTQTAAQMHISEDSVATHLARAYTTLAARNRTQAVATAIRTGAIK